MRFKHTATAATLFASALLATVLIGPVAFAQPATAPVARPTTPVAPPVATTPVAPRVAAPAAPASTAPAAAPAPTMAAPVAGMTNINTASAADLDKLPQIGKSRAAKIIAGRPYKTTDELVAKKVLSKGVFDKIKDKITI